MFFVLPDISTYLVEFQLSAFLRFKSNLDEPLVSVFVENESHNEAFNL